MGKKPGKGHNVNEVVKTSELKAFVERIENVEEKISDLSDDRKAVYAEAKAQGFDTKVLRRCVRERKMDLEKLREYEELTGLYRDALGMLIGTPLGESAVKAGHA